MAEKKMSSIAVSAFCENMAMMQAAGIPASEALGLLCEDSESGAFHEAVRAAGALASQGEPFAAALRGCGWFPEYLCDMVDAGEEAGRTEAVLRSLAAYYDTQDQLESKLRSAVLYPAVLLLLMGVVLAVMVSQVLPVFTQVYTALAGSVAASSYAYIRGAYAVGWVALAVIVVLCALLLTGACMARTERGAGTLRSLFEKCPLTAPAFLQMAQARFTAALYTFVASGMDSDTAVQRAAAMVQHKRFAAHLAAAQIRMSDGRTLAQAFYEEKIYEPLYVRMLLSASRSGQIEQTLRRLSEIFNREAGARMDRLIGSIEPALAGFLTVCVGLSLLSVMLPLVGILSSIS